MAATLLPEGRQSFTTPTGAPLVGGRLYTFAAGTSTPKATYADAAATVPNTNPVVLDARGEALVYWVGAYKVELRAADNSLIWTTDNVYGSDVAVSELEAALALPTGAGKSGYSEAETYPAGSLGAEVKAIRAHLRRSVWLEDLGWVPSGLDASIAANNLAVDAWITHAAANPGTVYRARKRTDRFRFTAINKAMPPDIVLATEGSTFMWSGDISGGPSNVFSWGARLRGDALRLELVDGSNWRRLVTLNEDTTLGLVEITAQTEGGVYGNNSDCALYTLGGGMHFDRVKLKGLFITAQFRGTPGGAAAQGMYVGDLDVDTYCKGPIFNNITGLRARGGWIRGSGTGKTSDPGFNSLLLGALRDAVIEGFQCDDAGEHGIRLGGWGVGEQTNKGVRILKCRTKDTGQTGIKVYTGVDDGALWQEDITLGECEVVNPRARSGAGGWNDLGFLIQQCRNSRAYGLSVFVDAGNPYAGMWISQCDGLRVLGYEYRQIGGIPAPRALVLSEGNGPADIYPTRPTYAINRVSVLDMEASGHSGEAVYVDIPIADARDIHVRARAFGGTDVIRWGGAGARAAQPCLFEAAGRDFSGALFNVPSHANLKTRNMYA